jgi:hypothetical protein
MKQVPSLSFRYCVGLATIVAIAFDWSTACALVANPPSGEPRAKIAEQHSYVSQSSRRAFDYRERISPLHTMTSVNVGATSRRQLLDLRTGKIDEHSIIAR